MTVARNNGQSATMVPRIANGIDRAIRQPTIPCASTNATRGTAIPPEAAPTPIAATMQPSNKAAGNRAASNAATASTDRASNAAQINPVFNMPRQCAWNAAPG